MLSAGNRVRENAFQLKSDRSIQTHRVVGAIQIDDVRLEILPKTTVSDSGFKNAGLVLLDRLICEFGHLQRVRHNAGYVGESSDVLELSFRAFAESLAEALEFGISRHYQPETVISSVIRGKINMRELMSLRFKPGSGARLSDSPLSYDNPFNQAVLYVAMESPV